MRKFTILALAAMLCSALFVGMGRSAHAAHAAPTIPNRPLDSYGIAEIDNCYTDLQGQKTGMYQYSFWYEINCSMTTSIVTAMAATEMKTQTCQPSGPNNNCNGVWTDFAYFDRCDTGNSVYILFCPPLLDGQPQFYSNTGLGHVWIRACGRSNIDFQDTFTDTEGGGQDDGSEFYDDPDDPQVICGGTTYMPG